MRDKIRPTYIEKLISDANKALKAAGVKNENDSDLFRFITNMLHEKNMYRGFNYYRTETRYVNGEYHTVYVLSGDKPELIEFVQIW